MEQCTDLKISPDGRFILKKDGSPFFWLADTAWELFHRMNRDDATEYLATRASQQFTVIQVVALSEFDGLTVPNAYSRTPLIKNADGTYKPEKPDADSEGSYWHHVDFVIDTAYSLGLYIGLLPTWGDKFNQKWGKGPEIFTPDNAYAYGRWIGARYKDRSNIIWIMGGDRPLDNETHQLIVRNMANGIKESTQNRHLMTFHPSGFSSSSAYVHNEQWLDFNMIQSGHGGINIKNYEFVQKDYALDPVKPVIDGEPRYEDHPVNFKPENGYFDDYDVRVAAYWAVLSGACGHTYGHHCIWSFNTEKKPYYIMNWREALHRPGAEDMKHVKSLLMSRNFLELTPCQELLNENYDGANYISAAKGIRNDYAFMYTPNGLDIRVNTGMLNGNSVKAYWYDPRNGTYKFTGEKSTGGIAEFVPPSSGRNNDWVLVLDSGR
jgi:hypothetical protein